MRLFDFWPLVFLLLLFSCNKYGLKNDQLYKTRDITLAISIDEISKEGYKITANIQNNSKKNIHISNLKGFSTELDRGVVWNLNILYNDSTTMYIPLKKITYIKSKKLSCKDYTNLRSQETYSYSFQLPIKELGINLFQPGVVNTRYGTYKISLTYFDNFQRCWGAFRYRLQSNVLHFDYNGK
jgi:hypothetical protein